MNYSNELDQLIIRTLDQQDEKHQEDMRELRQLLESLEKTWAAHFQQQAAQLNVLSDQLEACTRAFNELGERLTD